MNIDKSKLNFILQTLQKKAYVPPPPAMPPVDPAMMAQGAPMPPMDPAMMAQGAPAPMPAAPPMDPAMMGGAMPMAPMDPAMMAQGAPQAMPPVDPATGLPIDPATGMPIDPNTGMPIDPAMLAQAAGMPAPEAMPPPAEGAAPENVMVSINDLETMFKRIVKDNKSDDRVESVTKELSEVKDRLAAMESMLQTMIAPGDVGMSESPAAMVPADLAAAAPMPSMPVQKTAAERRAQFEEDRQIKRQPVIDAIRRMRGLK